MFCRSYPQFEDSLNLPAFLHETPPDEDMDPDDPENADTDQLQSPDSDDEPYSAPTEKKEKDIPQNADSLIYVFAVFCKSGLKNAYQNIAAALTLAVVLPVASAAPERSFSKLKLILTRLRSTMGDDRLEDLMLLSCEPDIVIDYDSVIDRFAKKSPTLKKIVAFLVI